MATEARSRGVDGVICGRIHKAEMRDIDGIASINDGDWVESCTVAIEHADGRIEIIDWAARVKRAAGLAAEARQVAPAAA